MRIMMLNCCLIFSIHVAHALNIENPSFDSLHSSQIIVVVTDNWNSVRARLYCFEKQNGKWIYRFSFPAVVGKSGMGLGEGLFPVHLSDAPLKKEGDGKSPAGIFLLGPAFGYADKSKVSFIHIDYIKASDTLLCIDDGTSRYYNQLIHSGSIKADWHSHEEMHRKDEDYKWGIFVRHNTNPVMEAGGSCIFLHVWDNPEEGTVGCTAMEEKNILQLLHWIQSEKKPVLVQFPVSVYHTLIDEYQLPELN